MSQHKESKTKMERTEWKQELTVSVTLVCRGWWWAWSSSGAGCSCYCLYQTEKTANGQAHRMDWNPISKQMENRRKWKLFLPSGWRETITAHTSHLFNEASGQRFSLLYYFYFFTQIIDGYSTTFIELCVFELPNVSSSSFCKDNREWGKVKTCSIVTKCK